MKTVRVELHVIAVVHVGDDIREHEKPTREPDASDEFVLSRIAPLGQSVQARDAAAGHAVNLLANAAPGLSERLRHELRKKGF